MANQKFESLKEAMAVALEMAINNKSNYLVSDENGNHVYAAKAASIVEANTDEELANMDWEIYADEIIDDLSLDCSSNSYNVKFDSGQEATKPSNEPYMVVSLGENNGDAVIYDESEGFSAKFPSGNLYHVYEDGGTQVDLVKKGEREYIGKINDDWTGDEKEAARWIAANCE